jgi:hypothetical protein
MTALNRRLKPDGVLADAPQVMDAIQMHNAAWLPCADASVRAARHTVPRSEPSREG